MSGWTIAIRGSLLGAAALLSACSTTSNPSRVALGYAGSSDDDPRISRYYGGVVDQGWAIPAIQPDVVEQRNIRQVVDFDTKEPAGTIVVDPKNHFLYLVMENGKAMRYGVGVGKAGYAFSGTATIARKASWPGWTPTANMIRRDPERYGPHAGGVSGGLGNPLGARAMYLYRNGQDTLYRVHGTNEPWTIGQSVSSGCIRMVNQDVIDLEQRTPVGTRVVVLDGSETPGSV
ncbi:L,D-transpeptidase [Aurantimonas sp. C2-6-R+9]|uniref:L,D-transpeptidase n=1 Tax=unclassified Aurantimonas TaxID=2638230 RepID=UPI002E1971F0|nr:MULTISPECIES: L,D-transpeptidase [unclassified Aurantimonas]MEC5291538.1 L,D-transpeptidase [Aurantimonas sp. C2-3-R2]MEC5381686.1 L,D-transpeptidase [Aurantimonas sp. C2-6-R+9]MEC5412624.1 L,D-transpeptidase [Aurantimonas sp. C2-4-R8]